MTATSRPGTREGCSEAAPVESSTRILAIDYGRKRLGLAISDELGLTARPLATLSRVNRRQDMRRLRDLCRQYGVAHILVGHPLHISGEAGEMAQEASQLAARLEKELGIETELVDERLTTWAAEQTLAETKSPSRRSRKPLDDVAAAILLREYLAGRNPSPRISAERE